MSAMRQVRTTITSEEYLDRERAASSKSEYVNGDVHAMAGGTWNHAEIAANILSLIKAQLRQRPCRAVGSDVKVRVDKANAFLYPDISGLCGPILHYDKVRDAYCNPAIIIEVLSPSTEAYDRGEKFRLCRLLESLQEYVLVRQDRVEVEVWTRGADSTWTAVIYNEFTDTVSLTSLNCSLTLADAYEKVEFSTDG